jgi:hypothetical protein
LALGEFGWLQTANFLVCGGLTLAGAVGLRWTLAGGRAGTWGPWLIALTGLALIVAGVFPADPMNGFPAGTADPVTWHGTVHSAGPALAGIAGLVAYVVFARRFAADHERRWVAWSVIAPIAIFASNATAFAVADFRLILISQLIGTAWTTSVYLKLLGSRSTSAVRA